MKLKKNYLLEKVIDIFKNLPKGRILDLGCGNGYYSKELKDLGFEVVSVDGDIKRFKYRDEIKFLSFNFEEPFPIKDDSFDYVLFLEVIEHMRTPFFCIKEISRILKPGGKLLISTPNILNISSRLRFLFEGAYDFFREPTLEVIKLNVNNKQNMHIIPWRYQDLEYLLFENNLQATHVFADKFKSILRVPFFFLSPVMMLQHYLKQKASLKKNGPDYSRTYKILMSPELLFGRHLIVLAEKK